MAVTASGIYVKTILDALDLTQAVVDLDSETMKLAMYLDALTPDFSVDQAFGSAPFTANQVTGTAYSAGGVALPGTTFTESPAGTVMFDATDVAWAASTIANAMCGVIYLDAIATPVAKPALVLIDFVTAYSTTAGTFTIQFSTGGIFTIDLTP